MNRAERRRQKKKAKKTAHSSPKRLPTAVNHPLNLALQHHNAGRLSEAENLYQQVLQTEPNQPVALHLLGVIAYQSGKNNAAVDLIRKALVIKPNYADAHSNLGNAQKALGRLAEAVESYRKALAIKPDYAEAYNNLGAALQELGNLDEAVTSYRNAIANKPDYPEAHNNLGVALQVLGKLDEAVESYRMALTVRSDNADTHSNLGNALRGLGRLDEAVDSYLKALSINPTHFSTWNNLGFAVKPLQSVPSSEYLKREVVAGKLSAEARASTEFAIHQFWLDGFRPHEADQSLANTIAALPDRESMSIPIQGTENRPVEAPGLPDRITALLHFGRSGTGLLHSLIDGHPEISTLPSIYLRGYFNKGVWERISADGWQKLPERFAEEFAVLFDARISKPIPSRLGETTFNIGVKEGMTSVGENRDDFLSLDRDEFCKTAIRIMEGLKTINPMSFLMVIHAAFEEVIRLTGNNGTKRNEDANKHLSFYHIHNPDEYALANFLRYAPEAQLLMTVREPLQNCESWLRSSLKQNDYEKSTLRILKMLYDIDQVPFRMRDSVGLRLEDLKARPEATIKALCTWLKVSPSPTLYEMTAQGKRWWGDPSSPDYSQGSAMAPFVDTMTKRPIGDLLSNKDRFILETLFYPFRIRFGYSEPNQAKFLEDLKEIRPLLMDMWDFEQTLAERLSLDFDRFKSSGSYQFFRSGLLDRWKVLDEFGDYPHMLPPLAIT